MIGGGDDSLPGVNYDGSEFFYFIDQRNRSEIYDGLFRYLFFE